MATFTCHKTSDGKTFIENEDFIPLVTHRAHDKITVYKLSDYTDELASQHNIGGVTVQKLWNLWNEIMDK